MNIPELGITEGKTAFILEVSNNHNGDFRNALRLITAAKEAGASAVKFQCYQPEELIELRGDGGVPDVWAKQGYTMRSLYEKAMTPFEWFHDLFAYASDLEIPAFASVFGPQSLALMESLNCPAYKLAALDFQASDLRMMVENTGKPVIRSCPSEIAPMPNPNTLSIYCPPGYPQVGFRLRNMLNGYDGFSYHGTDPNVGVIASGMGAKVFECHVMLDSVPSELESNISLTVSQFTWMVDRARRTEAELNPSAA